MNTIQRVFLSPILAGLIFLMIITTESKSDESAPRAAQDGKINVIAK